MALNVYKHVKMAASDAEHVPSDGPKFSPGAAPYGNFINYYQFNSVSERVSLIPKNILQVCNSNSKCLVGLDIGCNTGDLTISLFNHLNAEKEDLEHPPKLHILGIDLDEVLIQRAQEQNPHPERMDFMQMDITKSEQHQNLYSYLQRFHKSKFDLVFCFSVTMWIHLNHGDSGLLSFLQHICALTNCLVVEPQPWKCYKTASRRMRTLKSTLFQELYKLSMRETVVDDIADIIQNCNMEIVHDCGQTKWKRPIFIFCRK